VSPLQKKLIFSSVDAVSLTLSACEGGGAIPEKTLFYDCLSSSERGHCHFYVLCEFKFTLPSSFFFFFVAS
jgi:hypothetical protein